MRKLFTFFAAILCAANLWATTAYVSTYAELSSAISDAAVENIIVTANIDVPCDTSKNAGSTDLTGASTAQLIIDRSLTLQSQAGSKYVIKRVAAGETSIRLKSLIAIRGNGAGTSGTANLSQNTIEVAFTNIIIDGGANWGTASVDARRSGAIDAYGNSGRAMIDVYLGGTLNLEDGVEIRNGFTTKSDNSLLDDSGGSQNYGGAIRVEYHNHTGGGTVNLKAGAVIHDCSTKGGYGGALGAYNYARLNLYGGTIYNCSSNNGGAIACTYRGASGYGKSSAGVIRMYGGTISNCCAKNGGAISTDGYVTDYILGGTITSCTASTKGSAISIPESGTTVHIVESSSGWLTISNCNSSGDTPVSDNTGNYSSIYLNSSSTISSTHVYQVTFMNYSEEFAVLHVLQDNSLGEAFPAAPVYANALFLGWFNGNTQVTGSTPITDNMTLTAQWTVASITSGETVTHYDVFSDALSAWVNNSTLTLMVNVTHNSTISINNTRTLDLNGHGLTRIGDNGGVFSLSGNANLTLNDSDPTAEHKFSIASPKSNGAGKATVNDALTSGYETFTGGYITGGYNNGGAGVWMQGGTFTMNGGTLIGNDANRNSGNRLGWGGAVEVEWGTFTMNGGAMIGNIARYGTLSLHNGSYSGNSGKASGTVNNGLIKYNSTSVHSGGIHTDGCQSAAIYGGEITNNYTVGSTNENGAGVFLGNPNANRHVSGNVIIRNNISQSGGPDNNLIVELSNNQYFDLTGGLGSSADVHVYAVRWNSPSSQDGKIAYNAHKEDLRYIVSDKPGTAGVIFFDGERDWIYESSSDTFLRLRTGNRKHTSSGQENTIWLSVNASTSNLPGNIAPDLTNEPVAIESFVYNGTNTHPTLTINSGATTLVRGTDYTVTYIGRGTTSYSESTTAPKETGDYIAKATFINDYYGYQELNYSINPAPLTCTADDKEVTYGDAAPEYTVSYSGWLGSDNASAISGSLAFACDYSAGSNVGDYIITPSGVTSGNYTITFNTGTLTVNKADAVITDVPAAVEGLVYTGAAQTLISAGSATGGELQYKVDASAWSTDLPQATAIGDHTVYYKVVGDGNHNSIDESSFTVSIAAVTVLYDNTDPTTDIAGMVEAGEAYDLTVSRTIYADGYFNTICLPFAVSAGELSNPAHPLYGYTDLKAFSGAEVTGSGQNLFINIYVEDATEIAAGVPYLISYPGNRADILNPTFPAAVCTATAPDAVTRDGVTFQGMFAPVHITTYAENTTEDYLFLGENNRLLWPNNDGSSMRGFRAYFIIHRNNIPAAAAPRGTAARIMQRDNTATGIEQVQGDEVQSTKLLRDGQLIIIRNGVEYNANGQMLK